MSRLHSIVGDVNKEVQFLSLAFPPVAPNWSLESKHLPSFFDAARKVNEVDGHFIVIATFEPCYFVNTPATHGDPLSQRDRASRLTARFRLYVNPLPSLLNRNTDYGISAGFWGADREILTYFFSGVPGGIPTLIRDIVDGSKADVDEDQVFAHKVLLNHLYRLC